MERSEPLMYETFAEVLAATDNLDALDREEWRALSIHMERLCAGVLSRNSDAQEREFHEALQLLLSVHQAMPHTWGARHSASPRALALRRHQFDTYLKREIGRLAKLAMPSVSAPQELVECLRDLNAAHPAARHPVFDYLREIGTLEDVQLFFAQEGAVDSRFDDLIALAQIGTVGTVKDEYAHNFADEMGHGDPERVHARLFLDTSRYVFSFGQTGRTIPADPVTEALACANMQLGLALDRRHVWRLAGYLAAFEYNAPWRCAKLAEACVRQGMQEKRLEYLTEHMDADVGHAQGLFDNIVAPLAMSDPRAPAEIVQGFALRLQTSQEYCDALLHTFVTRSH